MNQFYMIVTIEDSQYVPVRDEDGRLVTNKDFAALRDTRDELFENCDILKCELVEGINV